MTLPGCRQLSVHMVSSAPVLLAADGVLGLASPDHEQRHKNRSRRDRHDDHHRWDWRDEGFDGRLAEFLDRTQRAMRRVHLTEAQVRECAAILDDALQRIRQTLKDTGDRPPDHRGANQ